MSNAKHLAELAGVSSLDGSVTVTDAKGVTQVFDTAADAAEAWTARLHRLAWRRGAFFERLDAPAPLLEVPQVPKPHRSAAPQCDADHATHGRCTLPHEHTGSHVGYVSGRWGPGAETHARRKKKGSSRRAHQRSTEDTSLSDDDA